MGPRSAFRLVAEAIVFGVAAATSLVLNRVLNRSRDETAAPVRLLYRRVDRQRRTARGPDRVAQAHPPLIPVKTENRCSPRTTTRKTFSSLPGRVDTHDRHSCGE